jgi:hypothetical protein
MKGNTMSIERPQVTWTDRFGESHTHPLFTEVTWDQVGPSGLSTRTRSKDVQFEYWMTQHDLEVQYASELGVPMEWARCLVPAALSDYPVVLTRNLGDMTVTETVMITQLFKGNHFYIRSWGHSGPVYLKDVVRVEVPGHHTVLHTKDGDKVLEPITEDERTGAAAQRYAAVSRVGTSPVPPVK